MEIDAFIALIEIKPRRISILDAKNVAGAFVRCYIPAQSRNEALARLGTTLDRDGLDLVEVEFCESFFFSEWENENEDGGDTAGISEALATNQVIYDDFYFWDHDAPDAT